MSTATIDFDNITLHQGGHDRPDEGHCLLEVVSMFAGEPFSSSPACVCPTLRRFGVSWNDGMRSDDERAQLRRYIRLLPGTAGTAADATRRAWMALDWSVRVSAPAWLELAGLADHAERLRARPELTGPDDDTFAVLAGAREASAAAWAAAGDAAGDAASAAAAAGAAAMAAAWDAASAAAAAGAAAMAATWDAAWAAAGNAASDALGPTVATLQQSAHDLYLRMIAAGPHDPAALAAAEVAV